MLDVYEFMLDGNEIKIKSDYVNKTLKAPSERKKQFSKDGLKYYLDKSVFKKSNLTFLPIEKTWHRTNELFIKRVWDDLWSEGWR